MKINENDLQKIRDYEKRRGINYAKTKGILYNWLFVIGFSAWTYMMLMVLFYILGNVIALNEDTILWNNRFIITVFSAFAVTLVTPILFSLKQKIVALSINICTVPILAVAFSKLTLVSESASTSGSEVTVFDAGLFGLKKIFYWRHGIPMLIVLITFIWMSAIIIRERYITNKELQKIKNNHYESQFIFKDE